MIMPPGPAPPFAARRMMESKTQKPRGMCRCPLFSRAALDLAPPRDATRFARSKKRHFPRPTLPPHAPLLRFRFLIKTKRRRLVRSDFAGPSHVEASLGPPRSVHVFYLLLSASLVRINHAPPPAEPRARALLSLPECCLRSSLL